MFKILIFLLFFAASQCLDLVDVPKEVIISGREKLEMLEENSRLPKYSDCWTNAIKHLKNGCRVLTDSIQSDLALHFTNCFLEMSGQEPLDCVNERTDALKRLCLKEMPDRAYSAYTEFFTQTQNMCYFLQNQVWHRETENTINNLNSNSRIVNEKLREASDLQNVLLEHQKQGLVAQETLLRNGEELSNSLNTSKATLQKLTVDIRESTLEHRTILEDLFKEFHLLHNWLVGRYSLIDKIVYFVISLTLIMISTSVNYTSGARIYLIMNLSANFLLELGLPSILALFHSNITPTFVDSYVWMLRKFFIFDSVLLFIYYLFKYEDKFNKQLLLLIEIKNQNRQILDDILMIKMRSGREYIRGDSVTPPRLSPVLNELSRKSVRQEIKPPTSFPVKNSPVDPLPVLVETENENDETMMPMRSFRSVSRASTVSQSSARYNLRRRTEIFPIKE
uniref:CSON008762 protein n=1 Tax=Culicoides sonorensis TaxID=179676 RepID=A0A336MZ24_CULSO